MKGKGVQREVDKNKGEKLRVEVCPVACAFVGKNATKIANQLGVHIRLTAPLQGVTTWTQIDRGSKDAIIQTVLEMFHIKDFSEPYVQEAIAKNCYSLYKDWRFYRKQKYLELLKEGKDPYANAPDPARQEDWKHMINNVWCSDQHKKQAAQAKINRAQFPYNHMSGSHHFQRNYPFRPRSLVMRVFHFQCFTKRPIGVRGRTTTFIHNVSKIMRRSLNVRMRQRSQVTYIIPHSSSLR